jgi:hypothetical protein
MYSDVLECGRRHDAPDGYEWNMVPLQVRVWQIAVDHRRGDECLYMHQVGKVGVLWTVSTPDTPSNFPSIPQS